METLRETPEMRVNREKRDLERKKPYTNYDRIKCFDAYSLSDALAHKADACWNCTSDGLDTCKSCWLEWLKQEARE